MLTVYAFSTENWGRPQPEVNALMALFEDASGGIWIAGLIPGREVLTRWDRASGQFRRYSDADGLQAFNSPTSFYQDPRGVLWIAFRDGTSGARRFSFS